MQIPSYPEGRSGETLLCLFRKLAGDPPPWIGIGSLLSDRSILVPDPAPTLDWEWGWECGGGLVVRGVVVVVVWELLVAVKLGVTVVWVALEVMLARAGVREILPGFEEGRTGSSLSTNCGVSPMLELRAGGSPRISESAWDDPLSSSRNSSKLSCMRDSQQNIHMRIRKQKSPSLSVRCENIPCIPITSHRTVSDQLKQCDAVDPTRPEAPHCKIYHHPYVYIMDILVSANHLRVL